MRDLDPIVKRCAGLDVHKKSVMITILTEQPNGQIREVTRQFGTFPKQRRQLANWLASQHVELVVMESTGVYWKSIYAECEKAALTTHVVNARHAKNLPGRKTDVKDSHWLATLGRYGLVNNSFIPSAMLRELRLISRHYTKLGNQLASEKNRLHKILDDAGLYLGNIVTDINGVSAQEIIKGLIAGEPIATLLECIRGRLKSKKREFKEALAVTLSDTHRFMLETIHSHIAFLEQQRQVLVKRLFDAMQTHFQCAWQLLQTIPGISEIQAALLLVELGDDMTQFSSMKHCCSWSGMCPGNNESAGKRYSGRTRKGNRQLRQLLCESAHSAVKTNCQFKAKFQWLTIRKGHKKSIVAIGHQLLRVIYSVLKNKQAYHDPDINYEELMVRKNAPRWIKALQQYGYCNPG